MKVEELSIGDWVNVNRAENVAEGRYREWQEIGMVVAISECFVSVRYGDDEFDWEEVSMDAVEPVPITPEILEKNGFDFGYTSSVEDMISNAPHDIPVEFPKKTWCYDEGDGEITIDFPNQEDGGSITIAYGDKYMQLIFDNEIFVHELQNALHLCKIEKEIEL